MIRIAVTPAADTAIAATPALGTVAVEPERAQDGGVHIWLDPGVVARLKTLSNCSPSTAAPIPIGLWRLRAESPLKPRLNGSSQPRED
jgi:hypothetical protein